MRAAARATWLAALMLCLAACAPWGGGPGEAPTAAAGAPSVAAIPAAGRQTPAPAPTEAAGAQGIPVVPSGDLAATPAPAASPGGQAAVPTPQPLVTPVPRQPVATPGQAPPATGAPGQAAPAEDDPPAPELAWTVAEQREVRFWSGDTQLAGQLDLPHGEGPWPLVVIIHHSGAVDRESYSYMAELLVPRGFAVFRFDKRGTGQSEGVYGCCEADDALAAYAAAVREPGVDPERTFIVAQSIGTRHVAERFGEFAAIRQPAGVALLSNLLGPDAVVKVAAPALIMVADSEPELRTVGPAAAAAHAAAVPGGTELYVAEGAEHTLFDVRDGPIDWDDPGWAERYHREAMVRLIEWLAGTLRGPAPMHGAVSAPLV